jgi:predicted dehydrogenase
MQRRLRMGMVGGGRGAFIGAVHRMAAALDGSIELVCGALSSDPATARASGRDLHLAEDRCYASWREMLDRETKRSADERMDFVTIVTPNHLHHPVAMAALELSFDVVCDKPMTLDLAQALELRDRVESSGRLFCLTHNYTGYPMVKEARSLIASGRLGAIRKVVVEYPQGWLAERLEATGQKQASWRTDPARAGAAGCMGDIGTHCHQLAEYVTRLEVESVFAELSTFVPGRALDDDGNVLLRFAGAARSSAPKSKGVVPTTPVAARSSAPKTMTPEGVVHTTPVAARSSAPKTMTPEGVVHTTPVGVLHASQISVGEENGLRLRVYGERGGLDWRQEEPNSLVLRWPDRPTEIQRTAGPTMSNAARRATRLPMGHPEGFIEAFANLYRDFALALDARRRGEPLDRDVLDFPTVHDGVRGMRFLDAVVTSARTGGWVELASDAAVIEQRRGAIQR